MKKIFLASSSPRRKELLKMCGCEYTAEPADIDETIDTEKNLVKEISHLALRKAEKIFARHPDGIVIGSDTIVVMNGRVFGKPCDEKDAMEMLKALSGHTHQVITGIAIISDKRKYADASVSKVTFADITEQEIMRYVQSGEPMDKAGAYAVQGLGARFVTHIDGDFYAVMGLPVSKVYAALSNEVW